MSGIFDTSRYVPTFLIRVSPYGAAQCISAVLTCPGWSARPVCRPHTLSDTFPINPPSHQPPDHPS